MLNPDQTLLRAFSVFSHPTSIFLDAVQAHLSKRSCINSWGSTMCCGVKPLPVPLRHTKTFLAETELEFLGDGQPNVGQGWCYQQWEGRRSSKNHLKAPDLGVQQSTLAPPHPSDTPAGPGVTLGAGNTTED